MHADINTVNRMKEDAKSIFFSGLQAVEPESAVNTYCRMDAGHLIVNRRTYDLSGIEHIYVIGAGKATAPMAAAVEKLLGHRITRGRVNVKYGHVCDLSRVTLTEAGHPIPDGNGISGSQAILEMVKRAKANDLVLCLMSGGGSALMPLPAPGLTLKDKQETIDVLLSCGASIHEINAIRKHISSIKGGRLAQAASPAPLVSLILSDVVGDDLDVIASGPTVGDSSTFFDVVEIIKKYRLQGKLPPAVEAHIESGVSGKISETPKSADPVFDRVQNVIVGSNFEAIQAARRRAETLGYQTLVLSSLIEGETREVARVHGAIAREIVKTGNPVHPPACILSGGETTVTILGKGLGGRCQEFALAAALDISGHDRIVVLCAGTDGNDGPTDAAGAVADGRTVRRAESTGLDARKFLSDNDAYHFFKSLGDLFITGPTNTNVMDLRILLVS